MNSPPGSSPREALASLIALAPRVARAAWLGAVVLVLGLAGTAVWAKATRRIYESETTVLFERSVQNAGAPEGDSPNQVLLRLQDLLTSRNRLQPIIEQLNLYPSTIDQRGMVGALEEMRKAIKVVGSGWFSYRVTYSADSREVAQNVLSRLVKEVIAEDSQRRIQQAEDALRFLETERKRASETVKTSEGALAAFLGEHPSLALQPVAGPGGSIRAADQNRLQPPGADVAALEMQAAQLEEALANLGQRAVAAGTPSPTQQVDPVLSEAQLRAHTDLQAAQKELRDKQTVYTNEHPDVKAALKHLSLAQNAVRQADRDVEEARKRGQAESSSQSAGAAADPAGAAPPSNAMDENPRVAALRHALGAVRAQIANSRNRPTPRPESAATPSSMVAVDTEWTRLSREVSDARERQGQLETRQFQAQLLATLVKGGIGGRLVMLDTPLRPLRPIAGRRIKVALVGTAMSVVLALLAMVLLAAFDDRLYTSRDVERAMGEGVIVVAMPKRPQRDS